MHTRFTRKGSLLWWGALLLLLPAISQAPSKPPRLFVYHALPGDTAWAWQSIVIDPPLTLTRDAAGQAHLGVALPVFVDNEVPSGAIDGVRVTFILASTPDPLTSLHVTLNGLALKQAGIGCFGSNVGARADFCSAPADYVLAGNRIDFTGSPYTPQPGDVLLASYRHQ